MSFLVILYNVPFGSHFYPNFQSADYSNIPYIEIWSFMWYVYLGNKKSMTIHLYVYLSAHVSCSCIQCSFVFLHELSSFCMRSLLYKRWNIISPFFSAICIRYVHPFCHVNAHILKNRIHLQYNITHKPSYSIFNAKRALYHPIQQGRRHVHPYFSVRVYCQTAKSMKVGKVSLHIYTNIN